MEAFQFIGLLRVCELNAQRAKREPDLAPAHAINTLLSAFAALEALASEYAHNAYPALYARTVFRNAGLTQKFERILKAQGRTAAGDSVPAIVDEISRHRIAITHSEPDNSRTVRVSGVQNSRDAQRFADGVRQVAAWFLGDQRPTMAREFDDPNPWLAP